MSLDLIQDGNTFRFWRLHLQHLYFLQSVSYLYIISIIIFADSLWCLGLWITNFIKYPEVTIATYIVYDFFTIDFTQIIYITFVHNHLCGVDIWRVFHQIKLWKFHVWLHITSITLCPSIYNILYRIPNLNNEKDILQSSNIL